MIYNRAPVLPIDVDMQCEDEGIDCFQDTDNQDTEKQVDDTKETPCEYDTKEYSALLSSILKIRELVHQRAIDNIHDSQDKQKADYDKRHSTYKNNFRCGDKVLLRNLRKADRKGGWAEANWKGPYIIDSLNKNTCVLHNCKTQKRMANKQNISNLKLFKEMEAPQSTAVDDVVIVGECDHSILQRFVPVDFGWQKEKCLKFDLCLVEKHGHWSAANKLLKAPTRVVPIIRDGNCFFRCIALLVTGSENDHASIRRMIVQHMHEHVMELENYTQKTGYINSSKMAEPGTWATDTEIISTASWLHTDIFVYSQYGSSFRWQKFPKTGFAPKSVVEVNNEKSMYIINKLLHYEVVEDVER